ncbi:serine protease snk-like [Lycorma delicatula]|uniref:serine protease snk-like n=1 Tax=Lycorma delicatula TaxID=130591 RepID=UPI003F50FFBF
MAAIGYGQTKKEVRWHCGGTLISEYYVLSAAHCMKSRPLRSKAKWALLGAMDLSADEEGRQIFDIVKRVAHPKYKPPSKSYDIILFKLSSSAKLNEYVRPACLNTDDSITAKTVTATGWGKTDYYNSNNNDVLLKVTLEITPKEDCLDAYRNESKRALPQGIHSSMICAGAPEGGKDTCEGDSGGPLTIGLKEPRCMYSIIGITSFGKFCGFATPAVYTRVSYFIPWILKEITN